jgi:hypothetical protein
MNSLNKTEHNYYKTNEKKQRRSQNAKLTISLQWLTKRKAKKMRRKLRKSDKKLKRSN